MIISGFQAIRFGREDGGSTAPLSRGLKARQGDPDGSTKQRRVDAQREAEQAGEDPPHPKTLALRRIVLTGYQNRR